MTQAEYLKGQIARLEAKYGKDALYVQDLKVQLAALESSTQNPPRDNPVTYHVGFRNGR